MTRARLVPIIVGLMVAALPAGSGQAAPVGAETSPVGSIRWLPANANEKGAVGADEFRLVVVHDYSLDAQGKPTALQGKGPFGLKFFTTSPDIRMVEHSSHVESLDELISDQVDPADQAFAGVTGDVRSGACAKAGTPAFSAAYSTTRTFFHEGATPYVAVSGIGSCEVVERSDPAIQGSVSGFTTVVKTLVPGFWIDVTWPTRTVPQVGTGRLAADVWYSAYYDEDGEDGDFYAVGDTMGSSTSTGSPGDYDYVFSFAAEPGSFGDGSCAAFPSVPSLNRDAHDDVTVQVPAGTKKVTFKLFPKGDWDMSVLDPNGSLGTSGAFGGLDETETVPSNGTGNISTLVPGTFTMRACNYTGEPEVFGAVIID